MTVRRVRQSGRRRSGFTMVEALMSLAITAILMVAMGSAFMAAGGSIENNDRYFRAVQQGRVALDLIMGEIRRCQIINTAAAGSINLTTSTNDPGNFNGADVTFSYVTTGAYANDVIMTIGTSTTPIATNVTNANFNYGPSSSNPEEVALTLTIQIGSDSITLSNSAAPRYLMTTNWN